MVVLVVLLWGGEVLAGSGVSPVEAGEGGGVVPRSYRGLSAAGHALGWSSVIILVPAPFLFSQSLSGDGVSMHVGREACFISYLVLATAGGSFLLVGVPLMMAAQHSARKALRRAGLIDSEQDAGVRRIARAVWPLHALALGMLAVDAFVAGIVPFPIAAFSALIAMFVAEACWKKVDAMVDASEKRAVSMAPWLSGIPGGFMVGLGGRF
jgi:hypothetical protein